MTEEHLDIIRHCALPVESRIPDVRDEGTVVLSFLPGKAEYRYTFRIVRTIKHPTPVTVYSLYLSYDKWWYPGDHFPKTMNFVFVVPSDHAVFVNTPIEAHRYAIAVAKGDAEIGRLMLDLLHRQHSEEA